MEERGSRLDEEQADISNALVEDDHSLNLTANEAQDQLKIAQEALKKSDERCRTVKTILQALQRGQTHGSKKLADRRSIRHAISRAAVVACLQSLK